MKIWKGYGSEHSSNLVMIGLFKTAQDAEAVSDALERLVRQANDDSQTPSADPDAEARRYSSEMYALLTSLNLYTIGPSEAEQFTYDVRIKQEDNRIVITTDEIEVSAFFKMLIEKGARIDVYSAHNHSEIEN
jgi:hypothetical protein